MSLFFVPRLLLIYSLGFLFLFGSCKSNHNLQGFERPIFYQKSIEIPESTIPIRVNLSYDSLLVKLGYSSSKIVLDIKEGSGNDPVKIQLLSNPLVFYKQNQFFVQNCMIKFWAKPSLAGIDAGWVEGKIKVNLRADISQPKSNQIEFKKGSFTYDWIEKPKIKIMGFGVNVSGVIDKYIQSNEEKIENEFLDKLNKNIIFEYWKPLLYQKLKQLTFNNYSILSNQLTFDLSKIKLDEKSINLDFNCSGILGLRLIDENFHSNFILKGKTNNLIYLYSSKNQLEWMINQHFLNTNLSSKKIELKELTNDGFSIIAKGFVGRKSTIRMNCQLISNDSLLKFDCNQIQVAKLKFPFQFFKTFVKNKIKSNVNNYVVDIPKMLSESNYDYFLSQLKLTEIRMNSEGVLLISKYKGSILQINP